MFGYVRLCKPEIKIKDYETYRAAYCSLCKTMGKKYGIISRFTLSYDFTFLALINMSLDSTCPEYKKGRCKFNPLKKCNYCKHLDPFLMPSAASIIMFYYKLLDGIADTKGIKSLEFRLLKLLFKGKHKKAARDYPEIEKITASYIEKQGEIEARGETSLDRAADPTATALSEILPLCSEDKTQKRVLKRLGYCVGRYIYILDAACDFEDDMKSGNYNALKCCCKDKSDVKQTVTPTLYASVNEATKAFELLDLKRYKDILGNILYLGLEETFIKELENEKSV